MDNEERERGRSVFKEFAKGIFRQNPTFVLMVGLCPTLATSASMKTAFWMGLAATAVLLCSNVLVSVVRRVIPKGVRIPCYIVIIASFVTMVELVMHAYLPEAIIRALGIFIPLIVVNCIILYRAEDFAAKHGPVRSILDALGMGLGFMLALMLIGAIRELAGSGMLWETAVLPLRVGTKTIIPAFKPMGIMVLAPGAFLVMGLLMAFFKQWSISRTGSA